MVNILQKGKTDPVGEFVGLWLNETNGALFVWNGKPILIGFSKDGKVVVSKLFEMEFKYTPHRNEQKYEYLFDYDRVPMLVLADVEDDGYEGSSVGIWFGSLYGNIFPGDDTFSIVAQTGNVNIGEKLTVKCTPTAGSVTIKLYVLSYE